MKSFSHIDSKGNFLDKKLYNNFQLFRKHNGIYIEIGANDGIIQSNTLMYEKYLNWKGILIEPSPNVFEKCKQNRSDKNFFMNCACVEDDNIKTVQGDFNGNCMSSVNADRVVENKNKMITISTKTLTSIINESGFTEIDFFSLDVEGYELNVLKGLDFELYRPKYILIEIYTKDYKNILKFMQEKKYLLHSNFTNYNKKDNPGWDQTHNDYLFIDKNL